MATLATTNPTLADLAKALDPDGAIAQVVEILNQTNQVLDDMTFVEGNLPTGHRTTIRAGLPMPTWRKLYGGVQPTKSARVQVTDTCGMLEDYAEVDKALADLNGNTAAFRLSEDSAFLESMNQTMADTLFYGNPGVDPKQFTGLATRYSAISGAANAQNVMDAGGSGSDNTSVYLVVWGKETVFCPFPKGSTAGLKHRDLGEESVADASGNMYQALRTLYQWDNGLVVKDWRYVVRICNIDVSDLVGLTGTQASSAATELIKMMARAIDRIPNMAMGRAAFYANRTVLSLLRIMALQKSSSAVTIAEAINQFGRPGKQVEFLGIPVRKVDRLLNTEARVT